MYIRKSDIESKLQITMKPGAVFTVWKPTLSPVGRMSILRTLDILTEHKALYNCPGWISNSV